MESTFLYALMIFVLFSAILKLIKINIVTTYLKINHIMLIKINIIMLTYVEICFKLTMKGVINKHESKRKKSIYKTIC